MGWKYRQRRRRRIRIYEKKNNQWSEAGRMKRRKRNKIKNVLEREKKRQGKIIKKQTIKKENQI